MMSDVMSSPHHSQQSPKKDIYVGFLSSRCHTKFQDGIVVCSFLHRSRSASPAQYANRAEKAVREPLEPRLDRTQVVQSSSCHCLKNAFRAGKDLYRGNTVSFQLFKSYLCSQQSFGHLEGVFLFQCVGLEWTNGLWQSCIKFCFFFFFLLASYQVDVFLNLLRVVVTVPY